MSEKMIEFEIEYSVREIETDTIIVSHEMIDFFSKDKETAQMSLMIATSNALNLKGCEVVIHSIIEIPQA